MATAWYTLVVGIIIALDGIVFLIFDVDGFEMPDWYIGIMLIIGVVGIILGLVNVIKKKEPGMSGKKGSEDTEEDLMEE